MKKDLTLLIMAAGAGSRFGGLKQIEPFGPSGEFIIDYSIYDALRAGFTKVVFIIKKENYDIFKETIGKRVEDKIKVEYVFQEMEDLPKEFKAHQDRVKPFGTGHAILAARNVIKEPFAVINADDFYGYDSYVKLANFLTEQTEDTNYITVSYPVIETMSENGSVKRGVCITENNLLQSVIECNIEKIDNKIMASPLDGNTPFEIEEDALVSMNIFGFTPSLFKHLETKFINFLEENEKDLTAEFLIPEIIDQGIKENFCKMNVVGSNSTWMGVTYKEDIPTVKEKLKGLIDNKEYSEKLWDTEV